MLGEIEKATESLYTRECTMEHLDCKLIPLPGYASLTEKQKIKRGIDLKDVPRQLYD